MKDKPEKLIKNKPSIIVGIGLGLFTVLYVAELCQYLLASITDLPLTGFTFGYVFVIAKFQISNASSLFMNILVIITPLLVLFSASQIISLKITKTALGPVRYSLMIYQLILVGYVLIYLFYQAISILIDIDASSDFVKLATLLELEYPYNIFGIFFIIFILAVYININARKISKYINK